MPFKKAKCEKGAIKMGLYGPAGSGKSLTALMIAEAIAAHNEKRIAYIDTENGSDFYAADVKDRVVHPAAFDFDIVRTRSVSVVNRELQALKPSEHCVAIVDSATHIWEAVIASYSGKKGPDGQIPMHAWGPLKKPWKELVEWMLNSPIHVLLCGRMGNKFSEDENGKVHNVGVKFKAEGETGYEPDFLLQLQPEQLKSGETHYFAYPEKDRTGALGGRLISLWEGANTPRTAVRDRIVRPLMGLLGKTHAKISTADESASQDAEAFEKAEREKAARSKDLRETFEAKLRLAETPDAVKALKAELSKAKPSMVLADAKALGSVLKAAEGRVAGQTTLESDPPANDSGDSDPTDSEAP